MIRSSFAMIGSGIAALAFASWPAFAQMNADKPNADKPTVPDKIEQKADQAGEKIKGAARDAKTGINDSWITAKTKIALFGDDHVKARQVHVETKDGVVMLRGTVDSAEAKTTAGEVAMGVAGVKDVKNDLQVVTPSQRSALTADDKVIAKNIEKKFEHDPQLKGAKVEVNQGVVSLTGEVQSLDASAKASEVAHSVAGVRSVRNELTSASR